MIVRKPISAFAWYSPAACSSGCEDSVTGPSSRSTPQTAAGSSQRRPSRKSSCGSRLASPAKKSNLQFVRWERPRGCSAMPKSKTLPIGTGLPIPSRISSVREPRGDASCTCVRLCPVRRRSNHACCGRSDHRPSSPSRSCWFWAREMPCRDPVNPGTRLGKEAKRDRLDVLSVSSVTGSIRGGPVHSSWNRWQT
jgi:hypothetical protein